MKRSEMIELLANSWLEHSGDFGELELEIADFVLKDLEKIGMLPPLNENEYHYMDNNDRTTVNAARPYFTWEKE